VRKDYLAEMASVPLLILDALGMRKLPTSAAEDLLELIMRRYERASTQLTSNRPVDDWGRLLGDTAAVTAVRRPVGIGQRPIIGSHRSGWLAGLGEGFS